MDNKIGILNTNLTLDSFIKENPQYSYSADDNVLSKNNGSWAFVFVDNETGKTHLTVERHVPEDILFELLSKYGGEFYKSEYDIKPNRIFMAQANKETTIDDLISNARDKVVEFPSQYDEMDMDLNT